MPDRFIFEAFKLAAVSNSTIYRLGISSLLVSFALGHSLGEAYLVPDWTCGPSVLAAWTKTEHSSKTKLAKKVDRIVQSV